MVRLARAGRADERDLLAALGARAITSLEHRDARLVLESRRDRARTRARRGRGARSCERARRGAGASSSSVSSSSKTRSAPAIARLEQRVALRQIARSGTKNMLDVGDERDQRAERDASRQRRTPAYQRTERDADAGDHLDRGVERGVVDDRAVVRVAVREVDLVELGRRPLLARVGLHHGHARDLLVEERVEPRGLGADVAEGLARCGGASS